MIRPRLSWALPFAVSLAGCGPQHRSADPAATDPSAAEARAGAEANGIVAAAQIDADRARIGNLENQVDVLTARVDTSSSAILEARIAALEAKSGSTPGLDAIAAAPSKPPPVPSPSPSPSAAANRPIPSNDTR